MKNMKVQVLRSEARAAAPQAVEQLEGKLSKSTNPGAQMEIEYLTDDGEPCPVGLVAGRCRVPTHAMEFGETTALNVLLDCLCRSLPATAFRK